MDVIAHTQMDNAARDDMAKRGGVNGEDAGMTRREARGISGERLPIPSSSPSTTLGMPTSEPKQTPTEESTRRHAASSLKASSPLPLGHHHRRYRQYQQAQPRHFSQELALGGTKFLAPAYQLNLVQAVSCLRFSVHLFSLSVVWVVCFLYEAAKLQLTVRPPTCSSFFCCVLSVRP